MSTSTGMASGTILMYVYPKPSLFYVGTGIDVRFAFHNENITDNLEYDPVWIKAQCTLINFNLPINVSYRVPVAERFYLTPFVGLNFRLQAYGNSNLKIGIPDDSPQEVIDWAENIMMT